MAGDRLFFVASGATGRDLWVSDGTAAGTALVQPFRSGLRVNPPSHLSAVDQSVLFLYRPPNQDQGALWASDGTSQGTVMLEAILYSSGPAVALGPQQPGVVLFAAAGKTYGMELWRSDGTVADTTLV